MKLLKKFFFALLALIVLIIAAAISFAHLYENEVKSYVLESLNRQIQTEINVSGVDFTILRTFPFASLEFKDVLALESWQKLDKDTLFYASSVFLKFNIWDIYHQKYNVQALELHDAAIFLKIDEAGTENYHFWKSESKEESKFSLQLEKFESSNLSFSYSNKLNDFYLQLYLHKNVMKGNFVESVFESSVYSEMTVNSLINKDQNYLKDRGLILNGMVLVDSKKSHYEFNKTNLVLDDLELDLSGSISTAEKTELHLSLQANAFKLQDALSLLNQSQREALSAYDIHGLANLQAEINGIISENSFPHIKMDFSTENASFDHKKSKVSLDEIFLKGSYTNGEKNESSTSSLMLNELKANFGKGKVSGNLSLKDFNRPKFDFEGQLLLDLQELSEFLEWKMLQQIQGLSQISLKTQGYLQNLDSISIQDWKQASTSGHISLKDISFRIKDRPQHFNGINGELELQNNSIIASDLKGRISKSDFLINGKFNNLIAFLLFPNENLMVDASLHCRQLELNELLLSEEMDDKEGSEEYLFNISDRLRINLKAEIDSLSFRRFSFTDCRASLQIVDRQMRVEHFQFKSMEGEVNGNLLVDGRREDKLRISSHSQLKNINIQQLFYDMDNFGQSAISYENLQGIATADISFRADWSPKLEINTSSLEVESDLLIEKGRLMNFKPLHSLSKYIELKELNDIHFSTLQNSIQIKDRKMYMPRFEIVSSAIDLSLEGSHSFDNVVDYRMTLIIDQLLGKKIKKPKMEESKFGYIEDDGLGRTRLFLKMKGNMEDPSIKYDTEQLKDHWKTEVKQEKKEVKEILNEEFGIFKKNSAEGKSKENQEELPLKIEWDDNEENDDMEEDVKKNSDTKVKKKSGFGKFMDKIAEPHKEEFEKTKAN